MRSMFKRSLLALAVAASLPMSANATNGYFAHGYGTKAKGMAGAGVALPQDAMAAATNPAGMVWVGDRWDLGAALFSPRREYTVTGNPSPPPAFGLAPGTVESDSEYFLIPHVAANWMLGADSSFGVAVYGNGGMNTDYPGSAGGGMGTFGGGAAGVDLMQLFITPTYSQKINDTASWGVGVILAAQAFEARGLSRFGAFSSDSSNLTNNDYDLSYGAGLRLGIQGEVAPGFTLGAAYTSEIQMSEFDDYRGLFAEQGDFNIPASATIGLAWDATSNSTLTFDIQRIWYSKVSSIANPLLPNLQTAQLGNDNGAGFGWDDMTIYKLGYQWGTANDWTWRVGVSHGDQPIPNDQVLFNILAPAVMETHYTFGFTKGMGKNNEFSLAFMYAPSESVRGPNPLSPGQNIELEMTQFEVEASWAWTF